MMTLQGECPMGCGQTLVAGDNGWVRCSRKGNCPDEGAASKLVKGNWLELFDSLQDHNTNGGPNWTPRAAAEGANRKLVELMVKLGLGTKEFFEARLKDNHRRKEDASIRHMQEFNADQKQKRRDEARETDSAIELT